MVVSIAVDFLTCSALQYISYSKYDHECNVSVKKSLEQFYGCLGEYYPRGPAWHTCLRCPACSERHCQHLLSVDGFLRLTWVGMLGWIMQALGNQLVLGGTISPN